MMFGLVIWLLLGIVTAAAILSLAKAGKIMVSMWEGNRLGDEKVLVYFICALAVVAGPLSFVALGFALGIWYLSELGKKFIK